MALETGSYVSDLVETNPLVGDPRHEGDDHMRLVKTCAIGSLPVDFRGVSNPIENDIPIFNSAGQISNKAFGLSLLVAGYSSGFDLSFSSTDVQDIVWEVPGNSFLNRTMSGKGTQNLAVDPIGLYSSANPERLVCSGVSAIHFALIISAGWQNFPVTPDNAVFEVVLKKNGSEVGRMEFAARFATTVQQEKISGFYQEGISDGDYFEFELEAKQLDKSDTLLVTEVALIAREVA